MKISIKYSYSLSKLHISILDSIHCHSAKKNEIHTHTSIYLSSPPFRFSLLTVLFSFWQMSKSLNVRRFYYLQTNKLGCHCWEKTQDSRVRNEGLYYSWNKQHESAYLQQFLLPSSPMKAIQMDPDRYLYMQWVALQERNHELRNP